MQCITFHARSRHLLTPILRNLTQINITHKKFQCFNSSLSLNQHHSQPHLLGFIDNVNDEFTLQTLHGKVLKTGTIVDVDVCNYMLSLCVKFKDLSNAHKVFDEMPVRDVRSWTILVSGYTRMGLFRMALGVFRCMLREGVCPNGFTLSGVFKCFSSESLLRSGKAIHGWILTNGVVLDAVLRNSIIDFYVKCDEVDYAKRLFDSVGTFDTVSWNIMMGAFLQSGEIESALDLFRRMPFIDVATWNTVISGLIRNGCERAALELLYDMVKARVCLNEFTFTLALVCVSSLSILNLGTELHCQLIRLGLCDNEYIRSSLIDMYSKCGLVDKATKVFKQKTKSSSQKQNISSYGGKSTQDMVSWSSMISGLAQNGKWEEALNMFCKMVHQESKVDKFTITTIVSVCADYGMLDFAKQIHALLCKTGHKLDIVLCSSLVDMYAKCGALDDAQSMFNQTATRNIVLWTALITGFSLHGHGKEVVKLFELMVKEGIQPNEVTFVAVLAACSHAGLVDEGRKYFKLMKEVYGINPEAEHFTCMADLFGRAGNLEEIKRFIYDNQISHLSSVWRAFLSACRIHRNYDMGKWVSKKLLELEPLDAEPYVLLSNMCSTSSRWQESANTRSIMQKKGVSKYPGLSWIQVNNQVHAFVMGDKSHPKEAEIYSYLDNLIVRLKEVGYCTDVQQVMQDVEGEQREIFLYNHSEKLAVVYGIISTPKGAPIRVMKNLRICGDCHNFMKYTSQLLCREIIVRDIRRFHCFKDGRCSCGDYW